MATLRGRLFCVKQDMSKEELFEDLFGDKPKNELGKHEPENEKFKKENIPAKYSKPEAQKKLKKLFNKLRHKAIYLNMEHEELTEEFEQIRRDFVSEMFEYCSKKNIRPPLTSGEGEGEEEEKSSNSEMNSLFREIMIKTHPDKNSNLSEEELERKVELYQQALEGRENGNFRKILQVALELNVRVKKISPELIAQLRKEIKNIEEHMKQIKQDTMYQWGKSNDKLKLQIFELLTKDKK